MTWTPAQTNTHQDHVIAHVIGATPLGHFIWDETAYLLLDIGFVWNIYLDGEMGLVPQSLAINELEADDAKKSELRSYVDQWMQSGNQEASPIESIELFESEDGRRLVVTCEEHELVIETSLSHRWTRIDTQSR
ncbi:MAG TPA: hypothetical protein VFH46_04135 [Pyrinomonadaceae bacterium]|nr:hypothetical protein [Pyrinomonadaceae bacterium]